MRISDIVYMEESAVSLPIRSNGIIAAVNSTASQGNNTRIAHSPSPPTAPSAARGLLWAATVTSATPPTVPTTPAVVRLFSAKLAYIAEDAASFGACVDRVMAQWIDRQRRNDGVEDPVGHALPAGATVAAGEDSPRCPRIQGCR